MMRVKAAFLLQLIYSFSTLPSIESFDVILSDVSCDESLPVYVYNGELELSCNNSDRCTFGADATLNANLTYSGLDYVELQNDYAYISAHLSFQTLEYDLFEDLPLPVCGSYLGLLNNGYGDDDGNDDDYCPADGTYRASIPYTLPEINTAMGGWLSTGWKGSGHIVLSSTAGDYDNKIGYCKFELKTAVTKNNAEPNELQYYIPSAMVSTMIVFGIAALVMLTCIYRACADCFSSNKGSKRSRNQRSQDDNPPTTCCGDDYDEDEFQGHKQFDPVLMNRSSETDDSYRRFKH